MEFELKGEHIELSQLLKAMRLVGTGGEAKFAVKSGLATLNGESCLMAWKKIRVGDRVGFGGKTIDVVAKKA